MALHTTRDEHDANPPETWRVVKAGNVWQLTDKSGTVLDRYLTRRSALLGRSGGFTFDLWTDEGRWFDGEQVRNWQACE